MTTINLTPFLAQHGVTPRQFIRAVRHTRVGASKFRTATIPQGRSAIDYLLCWSATNEGSEFWYNINTKFRAKYEPEIYEGYIVLLTPKFKLKAYT